MPSPLTCSRSPTSCTLAASLPSTSPPSLPDVGRPLSLAGSSAMPLICPWGSRLPEGRAILTCPLTLPGPAHTARGSQLPAGWISDASTWWAVPPTALLLRPVAWSPLGGLEDVHLAPTPTESESAVNKVAKVTISTFKLDKDCSGIRFLLFKHP